MPSSRAAGGAKGARSGSLRRSVALVLRYTRAYRGPIAVGLTATVVLVVIQLAVPWIVRRLVASVQESVAGSVPLAVVGWLAIGLLEEMVDQAERLARDAGA